MFPIIIEKSFCRRTWGKALEHCSGQWGSQWTLPSVLPGVWAKCEFCGRPLGFLQKRKQQCTSLIKRSPGIQLLLTFSTEFSKMVTRGSLGPVYCLTQARLKRLNGLAMCQMYLSITILLIFSQVIKPVYWALATVTYNRHLFTAQHTVMSEEVKYRQHWYFCRIKQNTYKG